MYESMHTGWSLGCEQLGPQTLPCADPHPAGDPVAAKAVPVLPAYAKFQVSTTAEGCAPSHLHGHALTLLWARLPHYQNETTPAGKHVVRLQHDATEREATAMAAPRDRRLTQHLPCLLLHCMAESAAKTADRRLREQSLLLQGRRDELRRRVVAAEGPAFER